MLECLKWAVTRRVQKWYGDGAGRPGELPASGSGHENSPTALPPAFLPGAGAERGGVHLPGSHLSCVGFRGVLGHMNGREGGSGLWGGVVSKKHTQY